MSLTPATPTAAPVIQPPTFGSTFGARAPNDTPSAFAAAEPLSHIASDSIPDEDTLRYGFQAAKNRYTDLVFYMTEGRQLRLAHSNTLAGRAAAIEQTLPMIPQVNRSLLLPVINEHRTLAQDALNEITDLDSKREGERQWVASQIQWLHDHARNSLQTLILDYHWPTIDVCRDLQLSHEVMNLVLNPVLVPSTTTEGDATNSNTPNNNENATIDALRRELTALKLHIQQQKPTTNTTSVTNPIAATNQQSIDHIFIERRRRTKLPPFSNGTAAAAQQWIEKYTRLCEFLGFTKSERLDELNAVLEGPAIKWFSGLAPDIQHDFELFKQQFLQHFGGGTQPSRAALAELKLLRQGTAPMSQFAPRFVELLHRAEIFSDALQLDYFSDRVHGKLQEAIYMRGASNLQEAINICIEVEYALARSGQTLPTYTSATPNNINHTTITNNTELTPAEQNNQWNNNRRHGQHGQQRHHNGYNNQHRFRSNHQKRNNNNNNNRQYNSHHFNNNRSNNNGNRNNYHNNYPSNNRQNNNTGRETRRCFSCGQHGHIATNCHRSQQSNSQQLENSDENNNNYNIFEHLLEKIPSENQHINNAQDNQPIQNQQNNQPAPLRFHVTMTIPHDNSSRRALIDTGSTLSTIRRNIINDIKIPTMHCPPQLIRYGNQSTQITSTATQLGSTINNIQTTTNFYIVEHQNEDIILGMDWLIAEDIILRPKTNSISKEFATHISNNANHEQVVATILQQYPSLTSTTPTQAITNSPFQHRIDTGDAIPVVSRDFRRSPAENKTIAEEVQVLLAKKIIQPSQSPWCSPVILIQKPDGSFRFCIDYRGLNKVTVKDKFPLPNITSLHDKLHGSTCLSTIDLKSGYYHIPVHPDDRAKTAFIADGALYEFLCLPFGVSNGPSSFMRFMTGVLQGLKNVLVYLDDIIVYSKSPEKHYKDLDQVLRRLADYNLKIAPAKCQWFRSEVKFLGFLVGSAGIRPDPKKVEVIKNWPIPKTVHDVQKFLGFCAFYHRFLLHLSSTAHPLHRLLRKDTKFIWDSSCQLAFDKLRQAIMKLPTLAFPDPDLPYDLHTDASTFGLGAVLVQNGRPVAFASRSLTAPEKNYNTTEQECLAIVWSLDYFYPYLYGANFTIHTDHAALKSILSIKMPRGRLARWILAIQSYQFTIVHRKGIDNAAADALSRIHQQNDQVMLDLSANNFRRHQKDDPFIQMILREGVKPPFKWHQEVLFRSQDPKQPAKPVLPRNMISMILSASHNGPTGGHFGIEKTLDKASTLAWWPNMIQDVKEWVRCCEPCQRYKINTTSHAAPMKPILPHYAGEIWAADIAVLPISTKGNKYLFVIMEYLTKWCITAALPSFDTTHIANILLFEVVLKYSTPRRLITDNGTNFISEAMNAVCQRLNIARSLTSVEFPQADGLVERMNRTLKVSLASYVEENPSKWDEYLPFVTFAYNTAKQASTGYSPFELLFGRRPAIPMPDEMTIPTKTYETETWVQYLNSHLPILQGQALKNMKQAQARQKKYYDKNRAVEVKHHIGQQVVRKNLGKSTFPKERWLGPYVVIGKNNAEGTSLIIKKQNGRHKQETTANVKNLRPWYSASTFEKGNNVSNTPTSHDPHHQLQAKN